MRTRIACLIFLPVLFGISNSTAQFTADTLNSPAVSWSFSRDDGPYNPALVPGSNVYDLLYNGQIPDPYLQQNYVKLREIEKSSWVYKTQINIPRNVKAALCFQGLDTYADVFLNGKLILSSNNMFRRYFVNIDDVAKSGENELRIAFKPVRNEGLKKAARLPFRLPADNEKDSIKISPFIRKAPFQFGWDINPALLSSGIWKPVVLITHKNGFITDDVILHAEGKSTLLAYVHGLHKNNSLQIKVYKSGAPVQEMNITPDKYPFYFRGDISGQVDSMEIGLLEKGQWKAIGTTRTIRQKRSIQLIREQEDKGTSFFFAENGTPFFSYGANYVPYNLYPLPLSSAVGGAGHNRDSVTSNILRKAEYLGMNMLRIWGGGWPEEDAFYEQCYQKNILIWQDLFFANTLYPSDTAFIREIKEEIIDLVIRLNKFPNLVLWCGNNEIEVASKYWGWQKKYNYSPADTTKLMSGYRLIFRNILPEIIGNYSVCSNYLESSPVSNWDKKSDMDVGDNHLWYVWHGEQPVTAFTEKVPRFASEFGFPSLPSLSEIRKYEPAASDTASVSAFLSRRMLSYKGPELLIKYVQGSGKKVNYSTLVDASQQFQKTALNTATKAHLFSDGKCFGSLMWQLNESWPGVTWSLIQWNGEFKFDLRSK